MSNNNGNKTDSNGNHYCSWCGAWIGNHNTGETPEGEKSYFAIIKAKYCSVCRPKAINQQTAIRLHNLRQRNKGKRKAEKQELELLRKENQLLREQILRMREEINNERV